MDVGTILSTTIAIVAFAGGAAGFYGKARGDSIIKYQANEIALRDGTIARLEKDNAAFQSENNLLRDQNKKLSELAQGNPHLRNLAKAITVLTDTVNARMKGTNP